MEKDTAFPEAQWEAHQALAQRFSRSGEMSLTPEQLRTLRQISKDGGRSPVWGPNGRELFYRNGEAVMRARLETEPTFTAGNPKVLFTGRYISHLSRQYDISPDGQRFLMIKQAEQTEETSARTELIVVLNWFEELKRLVPTDK